jgi:hypothetical protein
MKIFIHFDECMKELSFIIDKEMVLTSIETENVGDFTIIVNGETIDLENDVRFYKDDEITVKITRDDLYKGSNVTLIGYDPYVLYDKTYIPESSLDEKPIEEEHIYINYDD